MSYEKKQAPGGCTFGKIEQENKAKTDQIAYIDQSVEQTNVVVLVVGAADGLGSGFTFNPTENVNLGFDEKGDLVINGKAIKGETLADGMKMFVLKETKAKNENFGNSTPQNINERIEGFQKNFLNEANEEDDDWEF